MSTHGSEHEEFLRRALAGELDADGAEVRARLAACPACEDELERLRALDSSLRATVARERDDFERARATADAVGEEQVRRTLTAELARRNATRVQPAARRTRGWLAVAVAASLLLLLGWAASRYLRPAAPARPTEVLLGGEVLKCLAPVGEVGEYGTFRWRFAGKAQWSFELTIRSVSEGHGGVVLRLVPNLSEPSWTPSAEEQRAWPDEIYWEVSAHDETGNAPPVSAKALASRRR